MTSRGPFQPQIFWGYDFIAQWIRFEFSFNFRHIWGEHLCLISVSSFLVNGEIQDGSVFQCKYLVLSETFYVIWSIHTVLADMTQDLWQICCIWKPDAIPVGISQPISTHLCWGKLISGINTSFNNICIISLNICIKVKWVNLRGVLSPQEI